MFVLIMLAQAHLYHTQLALGQVHKFYLLDRDSFTGSPVNRLEDGSKGAFAQWLSQPLHKEFTR